LDGVDAENPDYDVNQLKALVAPAAHYYYILINKVALQLEVYRQVAYSSK
jgi:hypothetical protein